MPALPSSRINCLAEYLNDFEEYLKLSSAWTRIVPRVHHTEHHWKNWYQLDADLSGLNFERQVFETSHAFIKNCWNRNGRFWEVEIYQNDSPRLPPMLRSSACAPQQCNRRQVETDLLPRYFGRLLKQEGLPSVNLNASSRAVELGVWEELQLDFVIAGIGGCGTTSLQRNLARRSEIRFSNVSIVGPDEDFFFRSMGYRSLPVRSEVERFNAGWLPRSRPYYRGLYNSMLSHEPQQRLALASIPGLRVVMVVCDPVGRFEKFWRKEQEERLRRCRGKQPSVSDAYGASHFENASHVNAHEIQFAEDGKASPNSEAINPYNRASSTWISGAHDSLIASVPEAGSCIGLKNIEDAVHSRDSLESELEEWVQQGLWLSEQLEEMCQLFGYRLHLIHQEALRVMPLEVFNRLARYIGVAHFPARFKFHRYNARGKLHTNLCNNNSAVRRLQQQLRREYEIMESAMAHLGSLVPLAVLQRKSHCSRPSAFFTNPCQKKRCND